MTLSLPPASGESRIIGFDSQARPRLVFGLNAVDRLGALAREVTSGRVLLVTDPGIVAAGHAARALESLERAGMEASVYDAVHENPTDRDVEACLAAARSWAPALLIALGGGSSMDTAKGCNFLLTNGGRMQDYWGIGKTRHPMLPLIAVPTTAGTGSECQSFALIADAETHQKMACGDPGAAACVALLDPVLTVSQPPLVTACSGIDAIAHGLETAVTRKRNELSLLYSRESLRLTMGNLEQVCREPGDLEARAAMQLGAAFGGMAIENSMLGAAHSAANPLTARFDVVHGQAVGLMLPHVVRFNAREPAAGATYRELALRAGLAGPDATAAEAAEALAARLRELLRAGGLAVSLAELGIGAAAAAELAAAAAAQWTAAYNPRPVAEPDFRGLYAAAA